MAITINIKSMSMDISPAIEEHINSKMNLLEKYLNLSGDRAAIADIEVGKTTNHHHKGDIFKSEINLEYNGNNFRSVSEKHDMYVAIDDCYDDLVRSLNDGKSKKVSLLRKGGAKLKNLLKGFRK